MTPPSGFMVGHYSHTFVHFYARFIPEFVLVLVRSSVPHAAPGMRGVQDRLRCEGKAQWRRNATSFTRPPTSSRSPSSLSGKVMPSVELRTTHNDQLSVPRRTLVREPVVAWLARKPPTLVHHFPAIHGDSAQTKGTVQLSIVSSS